MFPCIRTIADIHCVIQGIFSIPESRYFIKSYDNSVVIILIYKLNRYNYKETIVEEFKHMTSPDIKYVVESMPIWEYIKHNMRLYWRGRK